MTMFATPGVAYGDETAIPRKRLDLPAEIRIGDATHSARVRTLHATGVELDLQDESGAGAVFADEIVVTIPTLGQYKARRLRNSGARAAYLFELTEFSRRALGALIAERFRD